MRQTPDKSGFLLFFQKGFPHAPTQRPPAFTKNAMGILLRWRGQSGLVVNNDGYRWLIKLSPLEIRTSWPGQHFYRQTQTGA